MNLPKAIEILGYHHKVMFSVPEGEHCEAARLGIEAMKRDEHNRLINNHPDQALLPGETED